MTFRNADDEICARIVVYGPPLSGKATLLRYLRRLLDAGGETHAAQLRTDDARVLTLDAAPREAPVVDGRRVVLRLETATGPVPHEGTWRQLLDGADAVLCLADGAPERASENAAALADLRRMIAEARPEPAVVLAFNRREGDRPIDAAGRDRALNDTGVPAFDVDALDGRGVAAAFAAAARHVFDAVGPGLGAEAARRLGALKPGS